VIVYMLMAVRFYLYLRFGKDDGGEDGRLPEWVVQTYLKFLRGGLGFSRQANVDRNAASQAKGVARRTRAR